MLRRGLDDFLSYLKDYDPDPQLNVTQSSGNDSSFIIPATPADLNARNLSLL